jgi:hypothetical protein
LKHPVAVAKKTRKTNGKKTTSDLIEEFLGEAQEPMKTTDIARHLRNHGLKVNPSVELSRMAQRGQIQRVSRGCTPGKTGKKASTDAFFRLPT